MQGSRILEQHLMFTYKLHCVSRLYKGVQRKLGIRDYMHSEARSGFAVVQKHIEIGEWHILLGLFHARNIRGFRIGSW